MDTLLAPISQPMPLPAPRVAVTVRPATVDDLPFMDGLQKKTTKQVGFMPAKQLEGKVSAGHVLVAEMLNDECGMMNGGKPSGSPAPFSIHHSPFSIPVGYLIGHDQYFKRDDVGVIYQINVAPAYRRSLVAATLLQAQFDRSAYGCRLYCCWCAQDIDANRFWESMGFVPLAFRTGSEKKSRVHIFWQKRIRQGDASTPWWFPSQTTGGSIRADRLVLPIPPGTHWSDAKPLILPSGDCQLPIEEKGAKPARRASANRQPAIASRQPPTLNIARCGLRVGAPAPAKPVAVEKPKLAKKPKAKNAPHLVAAARELRDRWLEEVNAGRFLPAAAGKYDVARAVHGPPANVALLPAA